MNTDVLYEALNKHGRFFKTTNGKIWFYYRNTLSEIGKPEFIRVINHLAPELFECLL